MYTCMIVFLYDFLARLFLHLTLYIVSSLFVLPSRIPLHYLERYSEPVCNLQLPENRFGKIYKKSTERHKETIP